MMRSPSARLTLLALALAGSGCGGSPTLATTPGSCGAIGPATTVPTSGPPLWSATDGSGAAHGEWQLAMAGERVRLTLVRSGAGITGTISGDGGDDAVDNVDWDEDGHLSLRRSRDGSWQWLAGRIVEGVLVGRVATSTTSADPPGSSAYADHVTGWSEQYFDATLTPRVFDLVVGEAHARLRLDRDGRGRVFGRMKVYATDSAGSGGEQVEYDVGVQAWDGQRLVFTLATDGDTQTFDATVDAEQVLGTVSDGSGAPPVVVSGARAEVLDYGLSSRGDQPRWSARTQRQVEHLMMADNPAPARVSYGLTPIVISPSDGKNNSSRDDDPTRYPRTYGVAELTLSLAVADPAGGPSQLRVVHGFVATPGKAPPAHGYPVVIALNGHDGSARSTLDPDDFMYWYGDAWARRGFVVLAVDIGHRPLADRANLYDDYTDGDAPLAGNGVHPAITFGGLDSDWEEDGERTWDVMRALDCLVTTTPVDCAHILVTGLSMGGEVATFVGALDERVTAVVTAGFTPDLGVMAYNGNHSCWMWQHGDARDYLDVADLHALVAPRALVAEVGERDWLFSQADAPFGASKEVTRRSRAAFAAAPPQGFLVYLHDGGHEYRFGNLAAGLPGAGVTLPQVIAPRSPDDFAWSGDGTIMPTGKKLVRQVLTAWQPLAPPPSTTGALLRPPACIGQECPEAVAPRDILPR